MLGIAAANAVLNVLEREPVLEDLARIGTPLLDGVNELISSHDLNDYIHMSGYPARHFFNFQNDDNDGLLLKSVFQQEALKENILAAGWHAPSRAHTSDDVATSLDVYDRVFKKLAAWVIAGDLAHALDGSQVQSVFRAP